MALDAFDYRDPGQLLADVVLRRPLREGDLLLVLVRDPSGEQKVVRLRSIPRTRRRDLDQYDRAQLLGAEAVRLGVPLRRDDAPWHSIMTIAARRGRTVFGPDEGAWLGAWLFSNHCTGAFAGDLILVTEHGWADQTTGWGGHEPRIRLAER